MKVTYLGPHAKATVYLDGAARRVVRGETIDVKKATADKLLKSPTYWTKPTTNKEEAS